jgi:hypothetical protein
VPEVEAVEEAHHTLAAGAVVVAALDRIALRAVAAAVAGRRRYGRSGRDH